MWYSYTIRHVWCGYCFGDIQVQLRDKLFVPEGSMLGVSTGEVETMRSEFDRDATMYVSDVCLQSASANDAAVNESHSGGVSSTTEMPHVRRFLELAFPYALTLLPCPCHGICRKFIRGLHNARCWTSFSATLDPPDGFELPDHFAGGKGHGKERRKRGG